MSLPKRSLLVLEDGRSFKGLSFGAEGETFGEMVFNTSMTGYQEILTDPSYAGQIVCMTYPLIGNYGVNEEDVESRRPWVEGFVVREASRIASSWRATETLDSYLKRYKIVGIEHIDTRALVRHIRDKGAMRAGISSAETDADSLLEKVLACPEMKNRELASAVTTGKTYVVEAEGPERFHVVCYDFGVKTNSLRNFARGGCRVTVVPADTTAEEVLAMDPDGIFLSNGPGDPAAMKSTVAEIRKLAENRLPMFGICLGHQVLGQTFGGGTFKLKFGHRGGNQPIKDLASGKVEITSHNHGFAVDPDSLGPEVEITHINLNDGTVAGIRHKSLPVFSVQYHPEAAPGPHDAEHHFARFIKILEDKKMAVGS
ncbi:MAG: carbamoyl-phosphate synthase small subunit [Acidobacteria bacterium]|nr:MAG: carbamoyl-phosphate synthase small subunit [Acidobacteriota bacterium]REK03044.1 MAG: carbamoyl-phosphate synthase small subunit [Acidobacteriota bacterium]REK13152.1 MAG: carbamoyl-phosphate synthase small subunit [Acidobacteriota bacterium]REK41146.1 MAG: carbamoyl-phosphate synthase small subunit [Acidobacteriota bacterium]